MSDPWATRSSPAAVPPHHWPLRCHCHKKSPLHQVFGEGAANPDRALQYSMGTMEAHLCVRSPCSLQVDATKVTRRPRTPTPPCCGVPSGRRGKSLGWGGEATGTQHHLPAYSCAFLQAEREHTLVRPQPEETCPVWIHWPLPPLCSAGETNYSRGEAGEEVTSCRVQTASVVGNPLEHRSGGLCALHTDFHHCPTAACDV